MQREILLSEEIERLKALAKELREQDNLGTENPIFSIQTKKRIAVTEYDEPDHYAYWYDGSVYYGEDAEDIYQQVQKDGLVAEISLEDVEDELIPMAWRWRTRGTFLTRKAAQAHLSQNHYHYEQPRIYVHSAWRNPEFELVRKLILTF